MKNTFKLLFLCFLIVLSSCKKDEKDDEIIKEEQKTETLELAAAGELAASIDSKKFSNNASIIKKDEKLTLTSKNLDNNVITLGIKAIAKGTYQIDATGSNYLTYFESVSKSYTSINPQPKGTIIITKYDTEKKLISGTFSSTLYLVGDASQSIEVTGSFTDVKYSEDVVTPIVNSFNATVDGNTLSNLKIETATGIGVLRITASNSTSEIYFLIDAEMSAGTANFKVAETPFGTYQDILEDNLYEIKSGLLTISKHDKKAKIIIGTFNFSSTNVLDNTDKAEASGSFQIKY